MLLETFAYDYSLIIHVSSLSPLPNLVPAFPADACKPCEDWGFKPHHTYNCLYHLDMFLKLEWDLFMCFPLTTQARESVMLSHREEKTQNQTAMDIGSMGFCLSRLSARSFCSPKIVFNRSTATSCQYE